MGISDYVADVDKMIKRDDIRGVYGENLDADVAESVGKALAAFARRTTAVKPINVVIGHDMRLTGPELASAMGRGVQKGGCRPIQLGLAGTELVGFLAAKYDRVIDAGVIITASHNPRGYNGFKMFGRSGQPLGLASQLPVPNPEDESEKLALSLKKRAIPRTLPWEDFAPDYAQTVLERGGCDFEAALQGASEPLKVAVEAGNGMGGPIMRQVSQAVPELDWTFSHDRPDGTFPHIIPNPLEDEYQQFLTDLVRRSGADVGVIMDGDGDRVILSDENGELIPSPTVAALIGERLREKLGPEARIAHNLACSWVVADRLGDRDRVDSGGPTAITPVGYGKIKRMMHHDRSIAMGAEHSGHYIFRDFWRADSGVMAGLQMLELAAELKARDQSLSEILKPLRDKYIQSGEINFQLPADRSFQDTAARAVQQFAAQAERIFVSTPDGCERVESYPPSNVELSVPDVRLEADDWWFCMRPSGTEGRGGVICRLYVEAVGDRELMEKRRDELADIVGNEYRM